MVEGTWKCWFCPLQVHTASRLPPCSAVSSGRLWSCGCKPDKPAPSWLWWVCSGEMKKTSLATSGLARRTRRENRIITYFTEFPLPFPPSSRTGQSCFNYQHSPPFLPLDLSTSIPLVWYRGFLSPSIRRGTNNVRGILSSLPAPPPSPILPTGTI